MEQHGKMMVEELTPNQIRAVPFILKGGSHVSNMERHEEGNP